MEQQGLILYLLAWGLLSIITYFLYAIDKKRSIAGKFRISESTLLSMTFLLGSLGAILAMYLLRHKTKHWYFVFVGWFSLLFHLAIGIYLAVLAFS